MPLSKIIFFYIYPPVENLTIISLSSQVYCILELLRDAFQSKISVLQIILEVKKKQEKRKMSNGDIIEIFFPFFPLILSMQALKVESGYICLIVGIFLVSIIPFCYTIAWCFSRNAKISGMSEIVHSNSRVMLPGEVFFQVEDKEKLEKYHCRKRLYVFILQCLIIVSM